MNLPGWRDLRPRDRVLIGIGVLALLGIGLAWGRIDIDALHARAARLNGVAVFIAVTLLPMAGFPVSILHVVTGVRFGTGLGLAITTVSILIQLLASYALVKAAPDFFARLVEPLRKRLPEAAHTPLTQFTMLLPGAPYFAQNYVLPLVGVPLGTYLLWSYPLHVVRSIVGVIFGHESNNLTPGKIAGFAVYSIAIGLTCAWSFRRLQRRMKAPPPGENDPKTRE